MRFRKLTLVLFAVLALSVSMLGIVSAATRGQDLPADADRTAAAGANSTAAADAVTDVAHGRAYLGLEVFKLTDRIRRLLQVPDAVNGLVVVGTHRGSPAAEAGLQRGDVAMSFDGHELVERQQLRRFLNSKAPGDVIEVVYYRDGSRHAVSIELGRVPDAQKPHPEWLKKVHAFLRAFPNALDGTIRVLDEDGAVKTFVLTPGEVVGIGVTEIAVEDKLGEVHFYPFTDRTVFYARYHQVRPGVIEPGMQVGVLTVDGALRAVVVTARDESDGPVVDAGETGERRRIAAEFKQYLNEARLRLTEAEGDDSDSRKDERIAKVRLGLAEIDSKLGVRLAEMDAKADARVVKLAAKFEERRAELEAKLRELLANAEDSDDGGDDDDD